MPDIIIIESLFRTATGARTTEPASLVYHFIGLHFYNIIMFAEVSTDSLTPSRLSPYAKFKMALKSKEVQRQYPNLLERFLDFCKFEGLDIEQKAIKFCDFVKSSSQEEVEDLIIRFVLFQKERIDKKEIYIRHSEKLCESNQVVV
jgi:hypothetical protein